MSVTTKTNAPQAFISSYAPRIRTYGNSLLTPVIPQTTQVPVPRTTKRGTTAINYAEDGYEDDDFDDSEGPRRRPTGLRSLRVDQLSQDQNGQVVAQLGKELVAPVDVQGIWREWMGKPKRAMTEKQLQIQTHLPLTLIPIRIDLDVQPFRPEAPLPTPNNARDFGIDESLPAYKQPDPTPPYRLKDAFLWNLHEALMTPDMFARVFVDELDFPNDRKPALIMTIANQIRTQLEEYAGVALHPLFHPSSTSNPTQNQNQNQSQMQEFRPALSRNQSGTPTPNNFPPTPTLNGTPSRQTPLETPAITATATPLPSSDILNPDDTYRCIINLNINLMNRLYSDKFEWSLLHPPGFAEVFAKQTCADLGLAGEWVPAMTHAIYEAVLRLKKEACENGGLVSSGYGEIDNDAAEGAEAGWRYDHEHLADEWEPKVEVLSKEEIEKREGDRERQIRRLRRETARFSSTANMAGGQPQGQQNGFFADPAAQDEPMGRGERSKKKRRFRSLSPSGRDTPDTTAGGGYGGQGGGLQEWERQNWRCSHCLVHGSAVWAVRDGPHGPRTLCHNCGYLYERDKKLPPWSQGLFIYDLHTRR
ncbi:SNF5-domain-containing protein [Saccharata proteae CBS 121410]|uniref:SNF5-domain-containing protein n=1 Tax=Saccharata proteae CBS 121410 TaxID=1314787 RepID=A0A9P4HNS6_9PEZI|nr:SNF5-domain-containing protein [Saccharata proteae CBS 121410]